MREFSILFVMSVELEPRDLCLRDGRRQICSLLRDPRDNSKKDAEAHNITAHSAHGSYDLHAVRLRGIDKLPVSRFGCSAW